jgi:alpha-ketoglutarate-dependent taurine dioxygenase
MELLMITPLFDASPAHPIKIAAAAGSTPEHLADYAVSRRDELQNALLKHGAILFRGFGLRDAADLDRSAVGLGAQPYGYSGGNSPRTRVAADVFTSTDYPASETISLHNEMSYLPGWPRRLFFLCISPPASGGQTSLANSHDVLGAIPPEIVETLQRRKLRYIRNFSDSPLGKSWQVTYSSKDRQEVETIVRSQGSHCVWKSNDELQVTTVCEPTLLHPQTGRPAWFNQAEQWHPSAFPAQRRALLEKVFGKDQFPHDCQYGDGDALDEDMLAQIRGAMDANKLLFDWQQGDLLMLDNITMMHGREPFKGNRKVLAYLSRT